jgi:hypothetical protein
MRIFVYKKSLVESVFKEDDIEDMVRRIEVERKVCAIQELQTKGVCIIWH